MGEFSLREGVLEKFNPFLDEVLLKYGERIHSVYIIGSALTEDYNPKYSDINSVFVLKEMDLEFLKIVAPLGKKYGKKGISAPLIMTPEYINRSLDVFPIEFINIKLLHKLLFGEDLFKDIEIDRRDLRTQCERELKVRLIGLRQGYISSAGDRRILTEGFVRSFSGYIPLFRGIIILLGKEPPILSYEVLNALQEASGVSMEVFRKILKVKREKSRLSIEELNHIFENCYGTIDRLGQIVDEIKV